MGQVMGLDPIKAAEQADTAKTDSGIIYQEEYYTRLLMQKRSKEMMYQRRTKHHIPWMLYRVFESVKDNAARE